MLGGRPGPLSSTSMRMNAPAARARTRTCLSGPSPTYFTALRTRLDTRLLRMPWLQRTPPAATPSTTNVSLRSSASARASSTTAATTDRISARARAGELEQVVGDEPGAFDPALAERQHLARALVLEVALLGEIRQRQAGGPERAQHVVRDPAGEQLKLFRALLEQLRIASEEAQHQQRRADGEQH